jgi:peptidyl-prolyl cis-trans isomerase SurA
LRNAGINPATLRERLRINLGWERWVRGRYGSRLRIGQDQVQGMLRRISEQASRPQYLLSEIYLDAARVGGPDEALNGAQQLIAQIQQGAPFGAVASQFSAAPSAAAGGDAGWLTPEEIPGPLRAAVEQMTLRGQLNGCTELEARANAVQGVVAGDLGEVEASELLPEFRTAAQALEVGQVSEPIRTSVGLHLVAVCGKRGGGPRALTAEQIENRLYGQQLDLIARRYMRDLRNSATIETR